MCVYIKCRCLQRPKRLDSFGAGVTGSSESSDVGIQDRLGFSATVFNHWAIPSILEALYDFGLVWFCSPDWPWIWSNPPGLISTRITSVCHTQLWFCLTSWSPAPSIFLQMTTQVHFVWMSKMPLCVCWWTSLAVVTGSTVIRRSLCCVFRFLWVSPHAEYS